LADGTLPSEAIRERLQAETVRRSALAAQLAALDAAPLDVAEVKRVLLAKATDVGALLTGDVQQGREVLRALLAAPLECEGFREAGRRIDLPQRSNAKLGQGQDPSRGAVHCRRRGWLAAHIRGPPGRAARRVLRAWLCRSGEGRG
jgi:hypothetical protein